MVNRLRRLLQLCILAESVPRVRIAIVLGEVAAGNLYLKLVSLLENVAYRPEVDDVSYTFPGLSNSCFLKEFR